MAQSWNVLRSKPHKEEFPAGQMELRRIGIFNPRIRVQAVNPRARKFKLNFPGTVFGHMDLEKAGTFSMQTIPGAAGLVTFGGKAADVPDGMLHAIRQRVEENNNAGGELLDVLRLR
jgi:transcriptional antiterminator RfaH